MFSVIPGAEYDELYAKSKLSPNVSFIAFLKLSTEKTCCLVGSTQEDWKLSRHD